MACTIGNWLLEGESYAILDKIEADILQAAKKWNRKLIIQHQRSLNIKILVTNGSSAPVMCISKAGNSRLKHVRAEYKDEKPDVSNFYRNIRVWCNFKFKLPKIKDLCIKSTEKVLQDEWMYAVNTSIVKLWNFSSRFQLNYEILLPVLNTFTVDTEEYSLEVNYKVNDGKGLKTLYHHSSFMWCVEITKHLCSVI